MGREDSMVSHEGVLLDLNFADSIKDLDFYWWRNTVCYLIISCLCAIERKVRILSSSCD